MAEYEPLSPRSDLVEHDRGLTKKVLGCFGLGSLGVVGAVVAAMVVLGALASLASGCDIEVGDPGDGKDSQHLAVAVAPASDLVDGSTIRVTSAAFPADSIVGVAVCLRTADTERKGVEACDETQGARFATTADGALDATYRVPRVITVGGAAYDCAAAPERCLVVAADADDYDRSGGQAVRFRSGLGPVDLAPVTERPVTDHLPIGAQPSVDGAPVAAGTSLEVLASGFQPGEPLLIAYCTSEVEEEGVVGTCEPVDETAALGAVVFRSITGDLPRADSSGAFTTRLEAKATVVPYGAEAADEEPSGTSTTTTRASGLRPGEVRCTKSGGGCTIVIAAAADTKRSAVLPYTVTG